MTNTTLNEVAEEPPKRCDYGEEVSTQYSVLSTRHSVPIYCALGAAWIGAVIFGWTALMRHAYQPAKTGNAVEQWPANALPMLSSADYRIVVFAHPFCPCTRATLNKLDESLTRFPGKTSVRVIFATAGLGQSEIADSPIVRFASQLKGVDVRFDDAGEELRRFGARISGEVFAFDRDGRRVFHGGVTVGRGHQGDSMGQQELERLVCGVTNKAYVAPVFGCVLPVNNSTLRTTKP